MATGTLQGSLKVVVDPNRLRAVIRTRGAEEYAAVGESELLAALKEAKVEITDAVKTRIQDFLDSVKNGSLEKDSEFVLAQGTPPTLPVDANFLYADPADPEKLDAVDPVVSKAVEDDGRPINFFDICKIRVVVEGQILGKLTPAEYGKSGVDVYGQMIPPSSKPLDITVGDGVELDADGETVRAKTSGRLHISRQRINILPLLEIKGNVDFESGSIESPIDVTVRGDVQDGFHVHSGANISVGKAVDAADLKAEGDIRIYGGISGRGKGKVEAGGDIAVRFCNEANLHLQGNLIVQKEILNSRVYTCGMLELAYGSLIGGTTYARAGARINTIGSDAGIKTFIAIGPDPVVIADCCKYDEQIIKRRDAANKIRETVKPLLAQLKRLLPAQRERATELMYEADRLEGEANDLLKQKEDAIQQASPAEEAVLRLFGKILPGTTLAIGGRAVIFTKPLHGPIRIAYKRVDRVMEVVAINQLTGSLTILQSREYRPNATG